MRSFLSVSFSQAYNPAVAVVVAPPPCGGVMTRQADVCHAYQILRRGGLKEENIVVFMYDDIAHNPLNPRPGIIINHPQGEDVYAGVPKVCPSLPCAAEINHNPRNGEDLFLIPHSSQAPC